MLVHGTGYGGRSLARRAQLNSCHVYCGRLLVLVYVQTATKTYTQDHMFIWCR